MSASRRPAALDHPDLSRDLPALPAVPAALHAAARLQRQPHPDASQLQLHAQLVRAWPGTTSACGTGCEISLLIGVVVVALSVVLGLAGAFMLVRLQLRAQEPALRRAGLADPGARHRARHLGLHLLEPAARLPRRLVDGGAGAVQLHRRLLHADLHRPAAALRHHAGGGRARPRRHARARCSGGSRCPICARRCCRPAALAFLQSFENFTTTYFAIGAEQTFTIFIANKVRQGVTPAVNAVAFIIVAVTVLVAVVLEVRRRRAAARAAEAARRAPRSPTSSWLRRRIVPASALQPVSA